MTNGKDFEKFIEELKRIRLLMKQRAIICRFRGERFVVVDERMPMEYMGPEFEIGSIDIFPESHKFPEINKILGILIDSEIVAIHKAR